MSFEYLKHRPHTRIDTLRRHTRVHCKECETVQPGVDLISAGNDRDRLIVLECGHRGH